MRVIVLARDKVVKIRYGNDGELNALMDVLRTVPGIDIQDGKFKG